MIRINDDYVIDVDENNYTLKKDLHKKVSKDDRMVDLYNVKGYYSSLESALNGAKQLFIAQYCAEGEKTLDEALKGIREINQEFVDTFIKAIKEA